jgi:cytochrome oxidase Cu insertion factor (SCO1/SenC/PrrC family)
MIILAALITSYEGLDSEIYLKSIRDISIVTKQGVFTFPDIVKDKPAILTFIYTRCSRGCYPFLLYLKNELQEENNIQVIVLSFDKKDTEDDMDNLAERFGLKEKKNWIFGVLKEEELSNFLERINFEYSLNEQIRKYEHPLVVLGLDKKANIVWKIDNPKKLYILKTFIKELKGEDFVPTYALEPRFLSCFSYDPDTGNWKFNYGIVLLIAPAILSFLIVMVLQSVIRRKKGGG